MLVILSYKTRIEFDINKLPPSSLLLKLVNTQVLKANSFIQLASLIFNSLKTEINSKKVNFCSITFLL